MYSFITFIYLSTVLYNILAEERLCDVIIIRPRKVGAVHISTRVIQIIQSALLGGVEINSKK